MDLQNVNLKKKYYPFKCICFVYSDLIIIEVLIIMEVF